MSALNSLRATLRHRYVSKGGCGASRLVRGTELQSCEGVFTALDVPSRRTATGAIGILLTASLIRLACDAENLHY